MLMVSRLLNYTVSQLACAAGLARGMRVEQVANVVNVHRGYIYKLLKNPEYEMLINTMKMIPLEDDIKEYRGKGTLMMMVAQLMYNMGEKDIFNKDE